MQAAALAKGDSGNVQVGLGKIGLHLAKAAYKTGLTCL